MQRNMLTPTSRKRPRVNSVKTANDNADFHPLFWREGLIEYTLDATGSIPHAPGPTLFTHVTPLSEIIEPSSFTPGPSHKLMTPFPAPPSAPPAPPHCTPDPAPAIWPHPWPYPSPPAPLAPPSAPWPHPLHLSPQPHPLHPWPHALHPSPKPGPTPAPCTPGPHPLHPLAPPPAPPGPTPCTPRPIP